MINLKLFANKNNLFQVNPLNKNKITKNKFAPLFVVLWGFNIIVGYSLLITLASVYNQWGGFSFVLLLIASFLAMTVGMAFARLSQKFYNVNGGIMFFINNGIKKHNSFTRFLSCSVGCFQIIYLPIVSSLSLVGCVWAFGNVSFTNNPLFIIGCIFFFVIISLIPYFGLATNRITLIIVWCFKWFILFTSIFLAITLFRSSNISYFFHVGYSNAKHFKYLDFVGSLFAFYFAFGGIEAAPSMIRDIHNSKHNIFKIIIAITFSIVGFYIIYYLLIGAALSGPDVVHGNINNLQWYYLPFHNNNTNFINKYNPIFALFQAFTYSNLHIHSNSLINNKSIESIILFALIVITQISNKTSGRMQICWANTRVISAYAKIGYLPNSFYYKKNKFQQFTYAYWLDFWLSLIIGIIFLIFYYLSLSKSKVFSFFINGPLEIATFIGFIEYICAFGLIVYLSKNYQNSKKLSKKGLKKYLHQHEIIKLNKWEILLYASMFVITITMLFMWIINSFINFLSSIHTNSWDMTSYLQLIFIFGLVSLVSTFSYTAINKIKKQKINDQLKKQKYFIISKIN